MPELGKYAGAVMGSWGVTLLLIWGFVVLTWVQSRAAKAKLDAIEARRKQAKE
ncbi:MAG TPA: heme exporter protein CcmD [Rhodobacterales bacterium]|nr:heme exporter protein CcmD [Rhodobacterales bacterium]